MSDLKTPYLNGHMYEYDLCWLVEKILSFESQLNQAIDLKTIHYADPIQWDITTQYAPNTVVVDPKTGTAYISKVAVPSGILLTNSNYWSVIFNYQDIYTKIMEGVAFYNGQTDYATKTLLVNDLVWHGLDLYRVTRAIKEGGKLIPGTNMVQTSIESLLASYYGRDRTTQVLNDTLTVSEDLTVNAGDIAVTSDNITIKGTTTNVDSDTFTFTDATRIHGKLPDSYDRYFDSTDYYNNNAIFKNLFATNNTVLLSGIGKNVKDFGATGDGITDDTQSFISAIDWCVSHNVPLLIPSGTYNISDLQCKDGLYMSGVGTSTILHFTSGGLHGDPDKNYLIMDSFICNITLTGTSTVSEQNAIDMCLIRTILYNILVKDFTGIGFNMTNYANIVDYQGEVNNGENHGLLYCNAVRCGIGGKLLTYDSFYKNLVFARCLQGAEVGNCMIDGMHVWGYFNTAIVIHSDSRISNLEIEAAIGTPGNNVVIDGANISIANLWMWNIRVSNFWIWLSSAQKLQITNLNFGSAGDLNPTIDATTIQGIGGTCEKYIIQGIIDSTYLTGVAANINGSGVTELLAQNALTHAIQPTGQMYPNLTQY